MKSVINIHNNTQRRIIEQLMYQNAWRTYRWFLWTWLEGLVEYLFGLLGHSLRRLNLVSHDGAAFLGHAQSQTRPHARYAPNRPTRRSPLRSCRRSRRLSVLYTVIIRWSRFTLRLFHLSGRLIVIWCSTVVVFIEMLFEGTSLLFDIENTIIRNGLTLALWTVFTRWRRNLVAHARRLRPRREPSRRAVCSFTDGGAGTNCSLYSWYGRLDFTFIFGGTRIGFDLFKSFRGWFFTRRIRLSGG